MRRYSVRKGVLGEATLSLFGQVEDILFQDWVEKRGRQTMGIKARECGGNEEVANSSVLQECMVHGVEGWRTKSDSGEAGRD